MSSTTETGRTAEARAAEHLIRQGHTLLDRNWRNRWCELDIVTRHAGTTHFIEVKYRRNTSYGFASEYISHDKSVRLMRAATAWNHAHSYRGPYQIDVVSVEGTLSNPTISVIENALTA